MDLNLLIFETKSHQLSNELHVSLEIESHLNFKLKPHLAFDFDFELLIQINLYYRKQDHAFGWLVGQFLPS